MNDATASADKVSYRSKITITQYESQQGVVVDRISSSNSSSIDAAPCARHA